MLIIKEIGNVTIFQYLVCHTIMCTGFPDGTDAETLKNVFSSYGEVLDVEFPMNNHGRAANITFADFLTVFKILSDQHYMDGPNGKIKLNVTLSLVERPRNPFVRDNDKSSKVSTLLLDTLCSIQRKCCSVSQQIQKFTEAFTFTESDLDNRSSCLQEIMQSLCHKYPEGRVMPFGLTTNNFGFKECSLDLLFEPFPGYLDMNEKNLLPTFPSSSSTASSALCNVLSRSYILSQLDIYLNGSNNLIDGENFDAAKHEYVSYFYPKQNLNCRIFCSSMLVVHNGQLLKCYSTLDARIFPLALLIRNWAKHHRIIGEKHLQQKRTTMSDYALIWMIIFYLQNTKPPVVPSVEKLLTRPDISKIVLGVELPLGNNLGAHASIINNMSVGELLEEFFDFYLNFDYGLVINPRTGKPLPRKKVISSEETEQQFQNSFLCVQDPLEPHKNLTARVNNETFHAFIRHCCYAACKFDPEEEKRNSIEPWGILTLFKLTDYNDYASLQYFDFSCSSSIEGYNCVTFFTKLFVAKRIYRESTHKERKNPNYFYKLVINCLLYIFNHTLLFDASIHKWTKMEQASSSSSSSSSSSGSSSSSSTSSSDEESESDNKKTARNKKDNVKKMKEDPDSIKEPSAKRFCSDNGSNSSIVKPVSDEDDDYSCIVNIKALVRFNTWTERWSFDVLNHVKSSSYDSDMLNVDKQISLKLTASNEQSTKIGSFMCQCSFRQKNGLQIEITCNEFLAEQNLLPFLTYFIPLKLDELFSHRISKLKKHFAVNR